MPRHAVYELSLRLTNIMVYLLHSDSQETTATNVFIFFFRNAAPVETTSREQNEATFVSQSKRPR